MSCPLQVDAYTGVCGRRGQVFKVGQARRRIKVPVLHLMEQETFNEQAGGGEGVSGL